MAHASVVPGLHPPPAGRRESMRMPAPLPWGYGWAAARLTDQRVVVALAAIISVSAYAWYSARGLTFGYADALSRMEIARRVLSSRTPGLAQLGTTWLPLQPMLMLPLIWDDTLFHDGFAGAFPSMAAYVIASLYLYRTARFLFSSRGAAWAATALFVLNPSVVYMQATAMSEVPMICTATVAVYYMLVWARSFHPGDMVRSAAAVAAGTGIRYDGWPLAAAFALVVAYVAWRREGFQGAQAWTILYGLLAFSGCAAWVIYNQVIFHDPVLFVFFGNSKNSINLASAPAYHNARLAAEMYGYASGAMVGWVTTALAGMGLIVFAVRYRLRAATLPAYGMLIPFAYYWLTFFLGFDSILLPQLGLGSYWNARFGLQMVPAMALFAAYLVTWWRPLVIAVLGTAVWFAVAVSVARTPFALQEPLATSHGLTSKVQAEWFIDRYHGGNLLISYVPDAPMMFYLMQRVPDQDFITDSNGWQYRHALTYPRLSVRWVVMDQGNGSNPVWVALHKSRVFREYFTLRKVLGSTMIYERVAPRSEAGGAGGGPPGRL
jgi:hypothetical protein